MSGQDKMNRREFLQLAAAGAVSLSTGVGAAQTTAPSEEVFTPLTRPGHVVRVLHSGALSEPERVNSAPVPEVVELMVNAAILAFTEQGDVAAAWGRLFRPADRVFIKVSCLGSPNMATNEAVVVAIIKGLTALGVPGENMVVYDQYRNKMLRAHFRPGDDILGVPVEFSRTQGYSSTATHHGAGSSPFAVAFERSTAVISVPVFKDHDLSGFTGAMKNVSHGCIENPSQMHRNHCAAVADIFASEMVRSRMRLVVADGLRLMYDEGPQDNPSKEAHNSIYLATDAVALDTVGFDQLEAARARHGLGTLEADGRPITYLARAAELGAGIHDRERITFEEHSLV